MCCSAFKNNESLSTNNIPGIFAKLLLSDSPGSILFNQYIQLAENLNKPIKTLNELEFKFYSPSGSLYEFNGLNHSFTLEIYEDSNHLDSTNINIKTGSLSNSSDNTTVNNEKNGYKKISRR